MASVHAQHVCLEVLVVDFAKSSGDRQVGEITTSGARLPYLLLVACLYDLLLPLSSTLLSLLADMERAKRARRVESPPFLKRCVSLCWLAGDLHSSEAHNLTAC